MRAPKKKHQQNAIRQPHLQQCAQFKKRLIERYEMGDRLAIQGDEKHASVTIHYKPIWKDYKPIRTKKSFGSKKETGRALKTSSHLLGEMRSLNINTGILEKIDPPKTRKNPFSEFESRVACSRDKKVVDTCTARKVQSHKWDSLSSPTCRSPCTVAGAFKSSPDIVGGRELLGASRKGSMLLGPFDT